MLNLDKNQKYLLACSFGPDSMALFSMLLNEGYIFDVAHVNYHLRDESDFEQKSLEEYCLQNKIKCFVKVSPLLGKTNIEARAREIRYSFFEELFNSGEYTAILVAHNQDDLIETFVMQIRRHNFVKYYGIKEEMMMGSALIIRPLLNYKKSDLLNYCNKQKIPYSIDKTNLENTYLRNQIRHSIIEHLSDEERVQYLEKIAEKNRQLQEIFVKLHQIDNHNVSDLLKLNDAEFVYAINMLIEKVSLNAHLSKKCCLEIRKALTSSKPNISFKINKIIFFKSYDRIDFSLCSKDESYSYVLEKPDELDTPFFYLNFKGDASNRNVSGDDYPLTIRPMKNGDTTIIKNYTVQIRRLYIDWKMPLSLRKTWPVIVNKYNKVIYVPRYQKNFILKPNLNFYVK